MRSEYNVRPLNPPKVVHNFTKVVVHFRYCWDWKTCPLYGIQGFLHFRGFDCTQAYVNTFRTKRTVCNMVDGCFSGVAVRQGSTVFANEAIYVQL